MKKFRILVLISLLTAAVPLVLRYQAWARQSPQVGTTQNAQPTTLRIVSPTSGEKLAQTFVAVQYQLMSPAATSTPTYELRLDNRDPVQTTDTTYTFNGLVAGSHDLVIQVVDANGTPVVGTRTEVKFTSVNPTAPSAGGAGSSAMMSIPALPLPAGNDLPDGNGSLPLLSVIGFGILVGGVISALRTRTAHK